MHPSPVIPPALLQPPPRDPAAASHFIASRAGVALRMLAGVWVFVALLIVIVGARAYLKYGEVDIEVVAAIAVGFGLVMSVTVAVSLTLTKARAKGLFSQGIMTTGRVRSVQPNISPDYPARIEIDFQDMHGRPGVGFFAIPWTKASWLNPGMTVPVMYVPSDAKLFGVYLENIGVTLGGRVS